MRAYVGVTDGDWYELLSNQPGLDEINFWQPGGRRRFTALQPGDLFLFKLHSPDNFIVGGGFFGHSSIIPISLAWEAFGVSNGATSLEEVRQRVQKYRRSSSEPHADYNIGCILLQKPFFLGRDQWVPVPSDWSRNIVQGKTYDLKVEPGRSMWSNIREALVGHLGNAERVADEPARYGEPVVVTPRLGQGTFRVVVTDAYERRCAITRERTLPVLQAAHIKPYSDGGEHHVRNGLLLRSDIHTLFDRGYVTVTPDHHLEVSRRIREEFENGRDYYALHGKVLHLPDRPEDRPSDELLQWHNEARYLG